MKNLKDILLCKDLNPLKKLRFKNIHIDVNDVDEYIWVYEENSGDFIMEIETSNLSYRKCRELLFKIDEVKF